MIAITGVLRDKYVMPDFVTMPTLSNFISMLIATWRKTRYYALPECKFINNGENILITGSTGIGKSYLASALAIRPCTLGYKVYYSNATKLFSKLKMTKADGSYIREISRIEKQDLLILDDFGIQPLDNQSRSALMEIIEDRHGKRSTIITSQLPVKEWYDVIGEKTVSDAILDRLVQMHTG